MLRLGPCGLALAALCAGASAAYAGGPLLLDRPGLGGGGDLVVTSTAFVADGAIPPVYSAHGGNHALSVNWTLGPKPTQSYAVAVEDPDAPSKVPAVHWLVWNIPPVATALSESSEPSALTGYRFGETSAGPRIYDGPHPPAGDAPHHYHVEVLALDIVPDVPAGGTIDDLAAAIAGHVVARGQVVGTFRQP